MAQTPRWKTLSRQDPDFYRYLDGSFSTTHVAVPTRSMNVFTKSESVTFEIIPQTHIEAPSFFKIAATVTRPLSLALSLGPVVASWLFARLEGHPLNQDLAYASLLGILFFHLAMNFLDDYFDHRRGVDRLNPRSGSRAIQNGWVRARTMFHAGLGFLGLAILCGLPVVLKQPKVLLAAALFALVIGWGFSSQTVRLKYRGLGELTTFLLSGPLLTLGFVWASQGEVTSAEWFLGCSFGFTTVLYYHLKNIENIMVDSQVESRTLAVRLGFDRSKRLFWFLAVMAGVSILGFDWAANTNGIFAIVVLVQFILLVRLGKSLDNAPSPLSSSLQSIRRQGLVVHWATSIAFALILTVLLVRQMSFAP